MARDKSELQNIDNSNLVDYPSGRIKDNDGSGNGTPITERVYGDIHEFFAKAMRRSGRTFNGLPDNEQNGYQFVEAVADLAGKNNKSVSATKNGNVLNVPLRVEGLTVEEHFIGGVNNSGVTLTSANVNTIIGSDNVSKSLSVRGDIMPGELFRIINRANDVVILRDINTNNINQIVTSLGFLIAASSGEVVQGTRNDRAVTPNSFLNAFRSLINGSNSNGQLASASRNGLLSAAQWTAIQNISSSRVVNIGRIGGIDIGGVSGNLPFAGDIIGATAVNQDGTRITVTLRNNHGNSNYFVRIYAESNGNIDNDNNSRFPVFRVISGNQFSIFIDENSGNAQNLTLHIETVRF